LSEAKFKYQHMVYPASPVHNPTAHNASISAALIFFYLFALYALHQHRGRFAMANNNFSWCGPLASETCPLFGSS